MKKILIIDDEEWLREMVHLALDQRGFEVLEAANGAEGIERASKDLPDLILCDVNMERVNGYLTLQSLRNQPATAAIPFILMTGLADNAGMRHGMELGADDYLPKPFSIEALYAAVDARLKKVQTVREEAERKLATLRDSLSMALPHELRTPLNGILAYGEMLASDPASLPPAEIAEMGQVIHDSGKRLERLIENFLIHAQIELLRTDPARVAALRKKITLYPAKAIEASARKHAASSGRPENLILELTDHPVAMSQDYLVKIVDELVLNAFKFSQRGANVRVQFSTTGTICTLSVQDSGRGMTADQIAKIDAYMQFDRNMHEQQGLGLGLAIVRRLVELHDGNMTIRSEAGGGTTVTVRIPASG